MPPQARFFTPLHHLLLALGMALCAQPLLAQQYCNSVNDDGDYILGQAGGQASAMHWQTGLVWKRCAEGLSFNGSNCTGLDATWKDWIDWGNAYLPRPFANQTNWNLPATSPDRIQSGDWRMGYARENVKITENCTDNPKVNRRIFPDTPRDVGWSASPDAGNVLRAWQVNFVNGAPAAVTSSYFVMTRLVRGGQPFASLASPAARDAAAGTQATFASVTLAPGGGAGTAWGGARVAGGGSPQFQVNGGAWVQEAIVQSGDSLTVRLTAPATAGSANTATLTLRSGQTTGTSDDGDNGGNEDTAVEETTASFTVNGLATYAVTTAASPASGGTVSCTPNPVLHGDTSTCSASANVGYTFTGWSGDCTGGGACTLSSVTAAKSVTASFILNTYAITAAASPAVGGTVACTPNPVPHGSTSTCSASANAGYTFTGWSGDCSGSSCTLSNVTAARSVTASFTPVVVPPSSHAITVTASPAAGGSASCTPNPVPDGANASCTATAHAGYTFSGFSGDCSGSSCTLSKVTSSKSVTANFLQSSHAITTIANPTVGGSVSCTPNPVPDGTNANCTATAHAGYTFSGFSGDCSGSSCMLNKVTSSKSVTANFDQDPIDIVIPEGRQSGQPLRVRVVSNPNGWIMADVSTQTFASLGFPLPEGLTAPHGLVRLHLINGKPGSSATVVLSYPRVFPPDTRYYKYGPTTAQAVPHWHEFNGAVISGNTITLTLTDGTDGDDDLAANGRIADPGGPVLPQTLPPGETVSIPALSEWALLLLSVLMGLLGFGWLRSRRG